MGSRAYEEPTLALNIEEEHLEGLMHSALDSFAYLSQPFIRPNRLLTGACIGLPSTTDNLTGLIGIKSGLYGNSIEVSSGKCITPLRLKLKTYKIIGDIVMLDLAVVSTYVEMINDKYLFI